MPGSPRKRARRGLVKGDPRRYRTPVEKWPYELLVEEVKLLRARTTTQGSALTDDERESLVGEVERANARAHYAESEWAAAREEAAVAGLDNGTLAGKPALAEYSRTWRRFATSIRNLPLIRETWGFEVAQFTIASRVIPNLLSLGVAGPRGEWESGEQDAVVRYASDPAFQGVLCRRDSWARRQTNRFLKRAARAFYRPSVWAIYEKGSESGAVDRLGTVVK